MARAGKTVNVHEAKTNLSRLLSRVEAGEEIVIARSGRPVARLIPFDTTDRKRVFGADRGRLWIAPDFDAPLPEDLRRAFEDGEV
jgi:prevent-host-death family protein